MEGKGTLAKTEKTPYNPDIPYHEDHIQLNTGDVIEFAELDKYKEKVFSATPKGKGFSVDPFEKEMPIDIDDPKQLLAKHAKIVEIENMDPNLPVYLVAITNNTSDDLTHELSEGFMRASKMVNRPFLGGWQSDTGARYLDVSVPMQFNTPEEATKFAGTKEMYQESIMIIKPNGKYRFLDSINESGDIIDKVKDIKRQPITR